MLLLIDTSNIEYIYLGLASDKIFAEEKIMAKFEQQEKLLISLQELFKKNKLSWNDIDGIVAVVGPGSFSSLRIGLAVANTLAWSKKIKIVGLKKSDFSDYYDFWQKGVELLKNNKSIFPLLPEYGAEPNINRSKKSE